MTPATPSPGHRIRPGCAGWQIPAAHRSLFGEGESVLARYATRFDVVEINSTFHRPHRPETFARWAAQVPATFRFSVKIPRAITHEARLHSVGPALDRFRDEVAGLGRNLGGLLVQLPPSLVFDARTAENFFAMLNRRFDCALACEPRHASWFDAPAERLWKRHGVARVAADPAAPVAAAALPAGAGRWRYWRWHGSPRMYYSSYDESALAKLASQLAAVNPSIPTWVIFDNTAHGHATADAARLQARLAPARARKIPG